MPKRIKGITVEIGGDTTKLETALSSVNSKIKNTQSQLRDVKRLLKLDPSNTELLNQKQKLLNDSINSTKEKLSALKLASEQANDALEKGSITKDQYDALQREIIETENALKNLESEASKAGVAVEKIATKGAKIKELGDNVSNSGKKMMPLTVGITALGGGAVKTAADFDSSMSKVQAVSGATGKELDDLRAKALEMGSKTKFSATEAAEAMNYMAMAGWKTDDMLSGIEGVMNLAAASGEDLATTSDILTDSLTAFGLSAKDSSRFADVLAAASSNANTNVSMMGETFKYAAPVAGSLGFSVEDTALAIGLMANSGIKASQAGTSLRTIMNSLTEDITITGESLGEVTIQTTNADGSMRGLSEILGDCRNAFSSLSESEKAQAAEALVGKNAMSGFLAIMNSSSTDIEKLSKAIQNSSGSSKEMADIMQDNLGGQLTILKSQLESLAISFGDILMPAIRGIVEKLQDLASWLGGMDEGTKNLIVTIALFVAAIGPVLIVVGKIISAVGTIMTIVPAVVSAISAVKVAMAALNLTMLANPIVLIIAAITALVAGFIYLWNTSEGFRQFWIDLWENIKAVAITIWNALKEFFIFVWDSIKLVFETVVTAISEFLSTAWETITTTINTVFTAISTFFTTIWEGIKNIFITVVNVISSFLSETWNVIQTTVTTIFTAISAFFVTIWETIKNVFMTVVNAISSFLSAAWNAIENTITTVFTAISTFFTTIWNAISSFITGVVNGIRDTISSIFNAIRDTITSIVNTIKDTISNVFNSIWEGIKSTVEGIYDTVTSGFNNAVDYIKGLAGQAFSWGADMISGIVDGIKSSIGKVTDAVSNVASTITSYLHFSVPDVGPLTTYESWMPDFMEGLAKGINKSKYLVTSAVEGLSSEMVVSPSIDGMKTVSSLQNSSSLADIKDMIISAFENINLKNDSNISIPVYLGGSLLDEVVVSASKRESLRSGGR